MKEVEAVKSSKDIDTVHTLLNKHAGSDFGDIWRFGINVALRISDLLTVKFLDIDKERRELVVIESKTQKSRVIRLNDTAMNIVEDRKQRFPDNEFLFQSHSNRAKSLNKPFDRSTVARRFKEVGEIVGIKLGTHSLRKTRGYMMHNAGVSIEQICRVLNHSSPAITMAYIGLTKEQTLQTYDDFEL
jgi:integrase